MKSIFSKKFFLMVYFPLFIVGLLMLFFCNYKVEQHAIGKTYFDTDKIPFNKIGLFGSIDSFTRISTNLKWIKSVVKI